MRVGVARLRKEIGATMIYVPHDQVEAMTLADKIVVLRLGRIVRVGTPMDLYRDPYNKFVAGFIGSPAMNFLTAEIGADGVKIPALNMRVLCPIGGSGKAVTGGLRPEHRAESDTDT